MTLKKTETRPPSAECRYQQAQALLQAGGLTRRVLNEAVFAHWITAASEQYSDCFWYIRDIKTDDDSSEQTGKEYRLVDAKAASNTVAFDHQTLAEVLAEVTEKTVDPNHLPITDLDMTLAGQADTAQLSELHFTAFEQRWAFLCDQRVCQSLEISTQAKAEGLLSPDGKKSVFIREHNLWLRDIASGKETALTHDGEAGFAYGCDRFGFDTPVVEALWSPDSTRLLSHQLDQRQVAATPIAHYLPKDGSLRPQLEQWPVAIPDDKHIEHYRLVVIDIDKGSLQVADYPPLSLWCVGGGFFSQQRLAWWSKDQQRALFIDIEPHSDCVRLVELDTATAATRVLIEQAEPNFLNIHLPISTRPTILPLIDSDELIWLSERSGTPHLYLYDTRSGELKNTLTVGDWCVDQVLHIDHNRRQLLVQTLRRQTDNPFYRDLCWVNIDTGALSELTTDAYEYQAYGPDSGAVIARYFGGKDSQDVNAVSPGGHYVVITRSRVDAEPVSVLIDRDGHSILPLETAEPIGLPTAWQSPEPVTVNSADGQEQIYGVIFRPPHFSPDQRYPVLAFSTPHPAYDAVPRTPYNYGPLMGTFYFEAAAYAALGFIVVMFDGLAQSYRRKALQAASDGRMASAFGFPDRIAGLQQLAKRDTTMDLDRVGIVSTFSLGDAVYGLLQHPEFYQAGVCSDFEDIRYLPQSWSAFFTGFESGWADEMAANLRGKLLLIHSMLDPEPPLATTLRLADALQAANKDFDLVLSPTAWHEPFAYGIQRSWDFLLTHLLDEQAPQMTNTQHSEEVA